MYRFTFSDVLDGPATIRRKTNTKDAGGGGIPSYTDLFTDIAVSLQPRGGQRNEVEAKERVECDFVAYTDTVYDLQTGDLFVSDSRSYIIKDWEPQGGTGEVFAIYLKLVRN